MVHCLLLIEETRPRGPYGHPCRGIRSSLNVSREVVANSGGILLSDTNVTWNAVNQYTKASTRGELPRMMSGIDWFGQVKDSHMHVPVVDMSADLSAEMGKLSTLKNMT
jgi:hypothetical protein